MTMIRPRRLSEIRSTIAGVDFQDWWKEVEKRRADCAERKQRLDDLLSQATSSEMRAELTQANAIETLYRGDECADTAERLQLEADELENRSFRAVSDFEEQRFRASEAWYRLGASEKRLEEMRDPAAKNANKKLEVDRREVERAHRGLAEQYEREMAKKSRLWEEVERIWARSTEVNLLVAEQRVRAKKIRKESEGLFALAEEAKKKASQLRAEADAASAERDAARARLEAQLEAARARFDCGVGPDFLYVPNQDSQKLAFCISLIDDRENYNIELKSLAIYSVERFKGVGFLEPARETAPASEEGDRRYENFLLRKKSELNPAES